jgi:pimeloyl-ACP methyl ester carboxylesterase
LSFVSPPAALAFPDLVDMIAPGRGVVRGTAREFETVKLHSTEVGTGTPVVLLHGFPLSSAIWRRQHQQLGSQFRVIAPDLRGHGASPAPEGTYEMADLARDVLELLDSLDIVRAVFLGHSMGGYVTLAAWKLFPERFLALGLVSSHAAADTEEGRQGRYKMAGKVSVQGSQVAADAMLPKLFSPQISANDPAIDLARQLMLGTPIAGIVGSLQGMAARGDSLATLATINVPALVLAGDQDQIIPIARAEATAEAMPRSTLTIIEQAGHLPMLERPEATTTAIRKFLSTVEVHQREFR